MKRNKNVVRGALLAGLMIATPITAASCAALPSAGEIGTNIAVSLIEQALETAICHGHPLNVCLGLG